MKKFLLFLTLFMMSFTVCRADSTVFPEGTGTLKYCFVNSPRNVEGAYVKYNEETDSIKVFADKNVVASPNQTGRLNFPDAFDQDGTCLYFTVKADTGIHQRAKAFFYDNDGKEIFSLAFANTGSNFKLMKGASVSSGCDGAYYVNNVGDELRVKAIFDFTKGTVTLKQAKKNNGVWNWGSRDCIFTTASKNIKAVDLSNSWNAADASFYDIEITAPVIAEDGDVLIADGFGDYKTGSDINGQGKWNLRSNTGVTAVVEEDAGNKYLRLTKNGTENAALLWDYSSFVAVEDIYTISYKILLPEEYLSKVVANISIADKYGSSDGPTYGISYGNITYLTGKVNDDGTSEAIRGYTGIPAGNWLSVKMVILNNKRKARLYIEDKFIDEIEPKNDTVQLNKFSVFLRQNVQSMYFDEFKVTAGADIPETLDDLIKASETVFTDEDGNTVNQVPHSGSLKADFSVDNILNEAKDIFTALAVYDKKGNLVAIDAKNINIAAKAVTDISLSVAKNDFKECNAKLFVWDSEMVPIKNICEIEARPLLWMSSVYGSNAVIQRDTEFNVCGETVGGASVCVEIDGKKYETIAEDDGSWNVVADAITVENNPHTIVVNSDYGETIRLENILAGEVWLLSGQSNMEFKLSQAKNAKEEIANANMPDIRLFKQTKNGSVEEMKDVTNGRWEVCSPDTVPDFSAVGYLFGKEIYEDTGVPIGLLQAAYGGARLEGFVSREGFLNSSMPEGLNYIATDLNRSATRLYNAMIAPLTSYSIKGCIFYQGCANVGLYDEYAELSKIMINDWRNKWGQPDMPFIITQLTAYGKSTENNIELWPYLREAQLEVAQDDNLINVGMAVPFEAGEENDIHPKDKHTPAHRLALVAKGMVYGMDVEYMYPSPKSYTANDKVMSIEFVDVYDGLECSGDELAGFEIMDENGIWYSASAEIIGKNIVNVTDGTHIPVAVRFGFAPYPKPMINLYNSAGLIATPFRLGEYE